MGQGRRKRVYNTIDTRSLNTEPFDIASVLSGWLKVPLIGDLIKAAGGRIRSFNARQMKVITKDDVAESTKDSIEKPASVFMNQTGWHLLDHTVKPLIHGSIVSREIPVDVESDRHTNSS